MPLPQALAIGLAFSLFVGTVNGWLVAYVEIPAIFATLAMGTLIYGFGRYFLFDLDVVYLPDTARQLAVARPGHALRHSGADLRVRRASVWAAICSCATPDRAAICARWATISSPPASPAFPRARSSSCNMCSRR